VKGGIRSAWGVGNKSCALEVVGCHDDVSREREITTRNEKSAGGGWNVMKGYCSDICTCSHALE